MPGLLLAPHPPCLRGRAPPRQAPGARPLRQAAVPPRALPARRPENVPGELFVDESCIDCDTCRWMCPSVYTREGRMSAVTKQPGAEDRAAALRALVACPTGSIRAKPGASSAGIQEAREAFPDPVEGAPGVYHCGYHSRKSYGAASYLVVRPEGNVLVDSPRFAAPLASRVDALGGVRYMVLTHSDDVADHQMWADRFGCERVIHAAEVHPRQGTDAAERVLEGGGPWALGEEGDLNIIFTPGHTAGCICLLHKPSGSLFTGDHLAITRESGQLGVFRRHCWHSLPLQVDSLESLALVDWVRVLPGHGRRADFATVEEARAELRATIDRERDFVAGR